MTNPMRGLRALAGSSLLAGFSSIFVCAVCSSCATGPTGASRGAQSQSAPTAATGATAAPLPSPRPILSTQVGTIVAGPSEPAGNNLLWNGKFEGEALRPWSLAFDSPRLGRCPPDQGHCRAVGRA